MAPRCAGPWIVGDEDPGAVEEEAGPAAVRRVPPGLLNALSVHALGELGVVAVVKNVGLDPIPPH